MRCLTAQVVWLPIMRAGPMSQNAVSHQLRIDTMGSVGLLRWAREELSQGATGGRRFRAFAVVIRHDTESKSCSALDKVGCGDNLYKVSSSYHGGYCPLHDHSASQMLVLVFDHLNMTLLGPRAGRRQLCG
jgi:hypothetical protein